MIDENRLKTSSKIYASGYRLLLGILIFLILWATKILPGIGVQRRVDISEGTTSPRFTASLQMAIPAMTFSQIEAYEWAVSGLTDSQLLARYGNSPVIRDVVIGEIFRRVDEQRLLMKAHTPNLGSKAGLNLEGMEEITVSVTGVEYQARMVDGSIVKDMCSKDGVCAGNIDGEYGMIVHYIISNPQQTVIRSLPCTVRYKLSEKMVARSKDFNCLAGREEKAGGYSVFLPVKSDWGSSGMSAAIKLNHREIKLKNEGDKVAGHAANKMRTTLAYKSSM